MAKVNRFKPKVSPEIEDGQEVALVTEMEEIEDAITEEEDNSLTAEDSDVEVVSDSAPIGVAHIIPENTKEEVITTANSNDKVTANLEQPVVIEEVKMVETKNTTPIERNVKVRLAVNHTCCVGGIRYHFEKNKVYNVPLNVKTILAKADMLKPL